MKDRCRRALGEQIQGIPDLAQNNPAAMLGLSGRIRHTVMRFAGTAVAVLLAVAAAAFAQVSPQEILNPQLKAAEDKYFTEIEQLSRAIGSAKFPFTFFLSRYVGVDPGKQAETDTRGIEFVKFHGRVVLKMTGNYSPVPEISELSWAEVRLRCRRLRCEPDAPNDH